MVTFRQKLDTQGKIYIRKALRDLGFDNEIEIAPNTRAAVMYPSNVPLGEVLDSLRIISQDLELRSKFAKKAKQD